MPSGALPTAIANFLGYACGLAVRLAPSFQVPLQPQQTPAQIQPRRHSQDLTLLPLLLPWYTSPYIEEGHTMSGSQVCFTSSNVLADS